MLLGLIFAILGIVLVVGGAGAPQARNNPMIRVGLWCFGAIGVILGVIFILALR